MQGQFYVAVSVRSGVLQDHKRIESYAGTRLVVRSDCDEEYVTGLGYVRNCGLKSAFLIEEVVCSRLGVIVFRKPFTAPVVRLRFAGQVVVNCKFDIRCAADIDFTLAVNASKADIASFGLRNFTSCHVNALAISCTEQDGHGVERI